MIYLYIAAAIAFAGLGLYAKFEHAGKAEAEAKVETLETKITAQNSAIAQTKAEGDRRVAEATKGVQRATAATAAARGEAARLRALAGLPGSPAKPTPPGSCPEKDAVAELRKGFVK